MASDPLVASMQKSKPPHSSKSVRRTARRESSLPTMSTVEMFPSIPGRLCISMPSDQFVETMHRSAFAGQPAKARFPGHRHAGWVRVGFHFFQRSLFVYLTGVIFNRAALSVQYRRIRNGIHYVIASEDDGLLIRGSHYVTVGI